MLPQELQEVVIFTLLSAAAVTDIKKREVSNWLCAAVALIGLLCFQPVRLWGLIPAALLFAVALFCGGIGGGDVKLFAALSVCVGLEGAIILLFTAQLSMLTFYGIYSAVQKIRGKTAVKYLPFVPFLLFGYVCTILLM